MIDSSSNFVRSWATSINEWGQVAGKVVTESSGWAFFYDDESGGFDILMPQGYARTSTGALNNRGDIVGYSNVTDLPDQASVWQRNVDGTGTFTDLGSMFNLYSSFAWGINDLGQVVGSARPNADQVFACLWERNDNGEWTFMVLGGDGSSASAVNNLGQIVGYGSIDGTVLHPCIWERLNGQWTTRDLGLPPSVSRVYPSAINNSAQVVGYAYLASSGRMVGFMYKDGVLCDINSFLPTGSGWWLSWAKDINDQGQIVGRGYNPAGIEHGFLMDTRAVTYSYTSTGSAVAIKDNAAASKAMTLTDNATITDLNVKVKLTHTRYADLKFELTGPDNVTRLLCNAGAVTGSGTKTLVFDDAGAVGTIKANSLSHYDAGSTNTAGKWTLMITDTVKNLKTGSFTSFTLDVVPRL